MSPFRAFRVCVLTLSVAVVFASVLAAQVPAHRQFLDGTWRMQSSCVDNAKGEQISAVGFDVGKWLSAEVPGTVVGAQVTAKILPDPDYGMNLKQFPGFVSDNKGVFA